VDLFSRRHTSDDDLSKIAATHADDERTRTAELLADIGEIDERRLYVRAGYATLIDYCTGALRLSEDAACRRIHAARAARRFPAIFRMCAEGRLNLTAVNLLAPHLTESNADEWLEAAAGLSRSDLMTWIAARRPTTELMGWVQPLPAAGRLAPARVDDAVISSAPARMDSIADSLAPARVTPIAATRFAVQCTVGDAGGEALKFARDTTGQDVSAIVEAARVLYARRLQKRKCGAADRPSRRVRPVRSARHIPAHVRRAVWQRDGGRCTLTADDGHSCDSRRRLEFDHEVPIARGGESTVDNVRLRCRAHNQFEAERMFGARFMESRREQARDAAHSRRSEAAQAAERDVLAALAALGYRKAQAKHATAAGMALPADTTLEGRVNHALQQLLPPHVHKTRADLAREFGTERAAAAPAAPAPAHA